MAQLAAMPDMELVTLYKSSEDVRVVSVLIKRYTRQIGAIAVGHFRNQADIEDLAQDVFLKLTDKLKTQTVKNFRAWLCTMVRNMIMDQHRKHKRIVQMEAPPDERTEDLDNNLMEKEAFDRLNSVLSVLNDKERECVESIYLKEKSYEEIQEQMGYSFNQLRGLRDRAIKKLREHISDDLKSFFYK